MAQNQNETEFFAVVATGRKGLEEMTEKMGGEIMAVAARTVVEAGPTWLKRAVVSIANNDGLKDVLQTKAGLFSVYKGLAKAATMGLQIGGQFPHAHLTPYDGKAELVVTADGYKHTAVHGPGAVLSSCDIRRVYEGEDFAIDFARGEVKHAYNGKAERGKLAGVYGVLTRTDGSVSVDYMTRAEALQIRDGHSRAYKSGKPGTPWRTDEDAMIEKTAAKKFLRKYAAEAEGLAMLFGQDSEDDEQAAPAPRDQGDRLAGRLDQRLAKTASGATPAGARPPAGDIVAEAEVIEDEAPPAEQALAGEKSASEIF